jgi:hypothetical protein
MAPKGREFMGSSIDDLRAHHASGCFVSKCLDHPIDTLSAEKDVVIHYQKKIALRTPCALVYCAPVTDVWI